MLKEYYASLESVSAMPLTKVDIVKNLLSFNNKYKLRPKDYSVNAGSALVMHSIREKTNDIDCTINSLTAWNKLLAAGLIPTLEMGADGKKFVIIPDIDGLSIDIHKDEFIKNSKSELISGINTYTLETCLKQKLNLNRPKDQVDIKNIKAALGQ